jgi:hypothetical protein
MCPFRKIAARIATYSARLRQVLRNGANKRKKRLTLTTLRR